VKYLRVTNPDVVLTLVPWFVPVNQSREDIFLELRDRLIHQPEDTFVLVVVSQRIIKGFVAAYARTKDVFLWQARSEGLTRKYVDIGFNAVCNWTRKKGFNKLVTIPNRATKIWARRWGFKEAKNGEIYKEL